MNPVNEHGDMIAISAYYKVQAQVDDLQRQLDNARTGWLCETCDGRDCEGQRQSELMFAENAALREKVDDWENAVLHARDNRSDEQHCTCVAPLVGKLKQLERENAVLTRSVTHSTESIRNLERKNAALREKLDAARKHSALVVTFLAQAQVELVETRHHLNKSKEAQP